MAYARAVTFEGANQAGADEIKREIEGGEPPEGLPATEILVLFAGDSGKMQVITFFDSEEDYRRGDEILQGMSPSSDMGSRASVEKYEILTRRTA